MEIECGEYVCHAERPGRVAAFSHHQHLDNRLSYLARLLLKRTYVSVSKRGGPGIASGTCVRGTRSMRHKLRKCIEDTRGLGSANEGVPDHQSRGACGEHLRSRRERYAAIDLDRYVWVGRVEGAYPREHTHVERLALSPNGRNTHELHVVDHTKNRFDNGRISCDIDSYTKLESARVPYFVAVMILHAPA